jgi:hypothetical protein
MGDPEPAPAFGERTVTVVAANAAVAKPKSAPQKVRRVRLQVDFRLRVNCRRRRSSEKWLAKGCTNSSWERKHGLCRGTTDAPYSRPGRSPAASPLPPARGQTGLHDFDPPEDRIKSLVPAIGSLMYEVARKRRVYGLFSRAVAVVLRPGFGPGRDDPHSVRLVVQQCSSAVKRAWVRLQRLR